jgi:hypothetical protein
MNIHSTNYFDTFIEVAEDTKADCDIPPADCCGNAIRTDC